MILEKKNNTHVLYVIIFIIVYKARARGDCEGAILRAVRHIQRCHDPKKESDHHMVLSCFLWHVYDL